MITVRNGLGGCTFLAAVASSFGYYVHAIILFRSLNFPDPSHKGFAVKI